MSADLPEVRRRLEFARLLAEAAANTLPAAATALWLLDESDACLVFAAGSALDSAPSPGFLIPLAANSLQRQALDTGSACVEDAGSDPRGAELPAGFSAALFVSLGGASTPLGSLCIYDVEPRRYTGADVERLRSLANLGVLLLEAERRSAEQEAALSALRGAEADRSRLAQVTTHQLRSPITIAQSLLTTLLKGYAGPIAERQRDILDRIANQLDFLSHLVSDYLELAASKAPAGAGQLGPVAVNLSAARAVLVLQPRAEDKNVSLILRPWREELVVWATEDALDAICHNLVENAVKYTPAGGQVTVSLARSGDEAQMTVADTGIGISQEAQMHLFEEFYRAPNARATNAVGTGLGLAIVKGLVERYRGRITVYSPGLAQGTTFTVFLPLYRNSASTLQQAGR
jgi:two-component system, OmpR family, phosphate regulon sensor histidine kinase PhoR